MTKQKEILDCCKPQPKEQKQGLIYGIIYGLIPHTFCILFVILSIVGATAGSTFLKKAFHIPHLFQYLVLLSFVFATLSAVFYLRRLNALSLKGLGLKWKYLTVMYVTTITINILFAYVILPASANINVPKAASPTQQTSTEVPETNEQIIKMDQVGGGYKPNKLTVKKGIPVKWIITSKSQSCSSTIYSSKLNIYQDLNPGENVINFTPTETGTINFSCAMGMYTGQIIVTE